MNDYIKKRQLEVQIPDKILNKTIAHFLQTSIIEKTRIFAGEDNEVYDAKLESGLEIIIRISRKGPEEFRKEQWAIDKCRKVGVPVAEILFIQDVDENLSISAQTKIPGDSIERGKIDYRKLDQKILKKLIVQAGKILTKIHSIKTYGFGKLNQNGHGKFSTFKEILGEKLNDSEAYFLIAQKYGLDSKALKPALQALEEFLKRVPNVVPVLNHCDYVTKHFFFKDENITGIIDFGAIKGHSPVHDFAVWNYWQNESFPLVWLKEGYENKKLFDENFDEMLFILKLDLGLYLLKLYDERNYPEGVQDALEKIQQFVESRQKARN